MSLPGTVCSWGGTCIVEDINTEMCRVLGNKVQAVREVIRLFPSTQFGGRNGQMGVQRLEDRRLKKVYLRSTLTESWFTCAPESSGRRSPVCSACRSPVRSARRSLDLGQGMEQSLEIG
jgi:hypothetical protein